jgi:hypothetical protein
VLVFLFNEKKKETKIFSINPDITSSIYILIIKSLTYRSDEFFRQCKDAIHHAQCLHVAQPLVVLHDGMRQLAAKRMVRPRSFELIEI